MLNCGHVIHLQCGKKKVDEGYPGPAISFGFLNCSECGDIMRHVSLEHHLWKQLMLMDLVRSLLYMLVCLIILWYQYYWKTSM